MLGRKRPAQRAIRGGRVRQRRLAKPLDGLSLLVLIALSLICG